MVGTPWKQEEVELLNRMANAGESWEVIGNVLNRTPKGCQYKARVSLVISDAAKKKRWEDSRKKQGAAQRGRARRWKKATAINGHASAENLDLRTRACSRCRTVFTTPHKCRFMCNSCNSYASSLGW
ncbi:hypothetical protein [Acetobacter pasteurianus]|uniref:Myb-like domain-containing protein n=1 Tax=Acetobacter ascendens TaxID=481146 RepID=A0A1Y0V2U1_9PROT|nr:hypothetical protein [Acetobacter pasteurianus]ARW10008.1 hypothetical protein S101447_00906 [Acetobacter ascendens]QHM92572.1 hypothetical protein FCN51_10515 [Acetobacter pasteurianus]